MPTFSRRKKKNRFSRLVADHIQSPKHGGSLVVETGFPTSLIDLYVRNRGRFRKSAVNDKDSEVDSTLTSFLSTDLDFRESIEDDVFYDVVAGNSCIVTSDDSNVELENSGEIDVEMSVEMGKLNPVLVMVMKVLLMIVLALGTKGFAVGFTVSALVLFLLEHFGKSLLVRSSLSADPKTLIESGFNEKKDVEILKKENTFNEVLEIKEVINESKETIRSEKESDEVRSEVVMEIRQKSSRRAIMKSKIKKLVPKKLRKSMGSKDDLIASEFKEQESVKREQGIKPLVLSSECSYSSTEHLCILNEKQDKIVEIESRRSSSSSLSSENDCNVKELGRESQQNSGYLALCLIVLVGLIGGRIMAVVLSLSWCLMLKKSPWINCKASQFLI